MERIIEITELDLQCAAEACAELVWTNSLAAENALARHFARYRAALSERPTNAPPMTSQEFAGWVERRRAYESSKSAPTLMPPNAWDGECDDHCCDDH